MPSNNKNPWLEHLYDTFNFFTHDPKFNAITSYPEARHLNKSPRQVASNSIEILDRLRDAQKQKNIPEIKIPMMEIPILDEDDERYNEGIQVKHNGTFLIGGDLIFKNNKLEQYSYSICIAFSTKDPPRKFPADRSTNVDSCCLNKYRDTKRIIRRIHFDYQPKSYYPFHLQIGGVFPGEESSFQNIHYCFDHAIERPRIPYEKKFGYVSLFEYMIREFDTPLNSWRIRNRDGAGWGRLLKEDAKLLKTIDPT